MLFNSFPAAAGGGASVTAHKITLTAAGWSSTNKTQSVDVTGVLADETKQLILPMPTSASMSAYTEAGIMCTGQAAGKLTFTADTVPTADVEVWVVVQSVNDVTPYNVVFHLYESPSPSASFTCNYTSAEVLSFLSAGKTVIGRLDYDVLGNITPYPMTMFWNEPGAVVRFECVVEGKTCTFRGMSMETDWVIESVN